MDYTSMSASDLAEFFQLHGLDESARAVIQHNMPPTKLACCPRRQLVANLGIGETQVDGTMRSLAWLMSLREGALIKVEEQAKPLGAAMSHFNIPITDALFGQVCGLSNLLVLSLSRLVDLLTGSGKHIVGHLSALIHRPGSVAARVGSAVPRFWSPRTADLESSIANLQICNSVTAAKRPLRAKDLLLMPPQRLEHLGFDAAVNELFDFFREYCKNALVPIVAYTDQCTF